MTEKPRSPLGLALSLAALLSAVSASAQSTGFRVESTASGRLDYDSNIFLNNHEVSDTIATANGSVRVVRDVAALSSVLSAGGSGSVYFDHSDQNTFDPFVSGTAKMDVSDKTSISGNASYRRSTIANEQVNARTRSDDLDLGGSLQNLFSEKLGYRVTGSYHSSDYLTQGYADVVTYSGKADALYVYSPKLTLLAGYSRRTSYTEHRSIGSGDPSSNDNLFNVGAEGELAPKVSGSFSIGWVDRAFRQAGFRDASALFLSSGLKWIPAEKTSVALDVSQDFDTTAANQSAKTFSATLGATQTINEQWSVDGSVAYSHANYVGVNSVANRRDDNYRVKARAAYALATNVSIDLSVGYGHVESTSIFSTYNHVSAGVGVTATF